MCCGPRICKRGFEARSALSAGRATPPRTACRSNTGSQCSTAPRPSRDHRPPASPATRTRSASPTASLPSSIPRSELPSGNSTTRRSVRELPRASSGVRTALVFEVPFEVFLEVRCNGLAQRRLAVLDRHHKVAAAVHDGLGNRLLAAQRVDRNQRVRQRDPLCRSVGQRPLRQPDLPPQTRRFLLRESDHTNGVQNGLLREDQQFPTVGFLDQHRQPAQVDRPAAGRDRCDRQDPIADLHAVRPRLELQPRRRLPFLPGTRQLRQLLP